ncbi:binding partner of ACD11 1-like [Phalaenopsis equestris]|uniref:binding partner of ACD11 1-like n=1 Tax=Phalaenopsis equestris TaxID=78828 RepID=UPI0009E26279|nr:binding partner of ACD11 1-like [Phalaenopsis equestris]
MSLPPPYEEKQPTSGSQSVVGRTEDVVASVLAKSYVLGKGTVGIAKSFDEKHRITSTAAAKVVSLNQKIGLSEKIGAGASAVTGKVREVDRRFEVSGKTKSAMTAAGQKVSGAGSAMMKNKYVFGGVSLVSGAFRKVGHAASEVGSKTKEKVMAEEMRKGSF